MSRAKIPAEERHPVSVFVDELQDYLALPTDFSDALAQARGLGVGFTMAHQYRSQLTPEIKAAIDTNTRNKIIFGLNIADAKDMASMSQELTPADFMTLPRYHIYTNLQNNGKNSGWISGETLPASPELRPPNELKSLSTERYGQQPESAQDSITTDDSNPPDFLTSIGRKIIS